MSTTAFRSFSSLRKTRRAKQYWGEQQGADGYVTKPFTREDLLRAVRRFARKVFEFG